MGGRPRDEETLPDLEEVMKTVADRDCRTLVRHMNQPRTAAELSEASDIPLSTTYRKIDRLEEAALIDEIIEIRDDGRHTSRYVPDFTEITVRLDEDRDFGIHIERPPRHADERLAHLWSEIRKGV